MIVEWLPLARTDLEEIFDYIFEDNPRAAVEVLGRIEDANETHGRVRKVILKFRGEDPNKTIAASAAISSAAFAGQQAVSRAQCAVVLFAPEFTVGRVNQL